MRVLIAASVMGLALTTGAQACELDFYFETSYVDQQVSAGVAESEARAAQDAALAQRDQNMEAARQAFLGRFGRALETPAVLTQASVTSSEKVVSDADRRSSADTQNP